MASISCKDMGMEGCNYVAKADDRDEAIEKLMKHGKDAHSDKFLKMTEMELNSMKELAKERIKEI